MFAASCLNFPTRIWEAMNWGSGLARWTKLGKAGSRQTEVQDHCKRFSSWEKSGRHTSTGSQRMMIASSACSRTSWNIQAAILRRTQRPSQESCCQIFFPIIRTSLRFPQNGRTLTDDVVDLFFSIYANRNVTDKVGPHGDLLDEFPYLGPPHNVL